MAKPENKKSDSRQMAASVGLVAVNTEEAIRPIARDILYTIYRTADEARRRDIEKVYASWYNGAKFEDDGSPIQSTALFGPPGHGKTTAFKAAAKKVCTALGMRYLENGTADAEENIGRDDFLFITQETSGVVSAMEWLGLPTSEQIPGAKEGERRMGRLISASLLKLQAAGAGVLLLDDFLNASPSIQGVGLSLTLEKRFNRLNLSRVYIGATGNLGAVDGTYTTRPSTALRNRLKPYFVEDTLQNWAARVQVNFNDELSDAGLLGFLQRHEDKFSEEPNLKESGGYATPRSWEALVVELRRVLRDHGGRQGMKSAMGDIRMVASSIVGPTMGADVTTYYHSLSDMADPLARDVILNGKFNQEEMDARFKKGFASNEQFFGYQYALALADYTVVKAIGDKGDFTQAIERFANGILPMESGQLFAFAVDQLQKKMAARMPQYSEKVNTEAQLRPSVKEDIAKIIAKNKHFNSESREIIISTLSGIDKFSSTTKRRNRRPD